MKAALASFCPDAHLPAPLGPTAPVGTLGLPDQAGLAKPQVAGGEVTASDRFDTTVQYPMG